MCGIVGAIAKRPIAKILIEGLKSLEYRGYDSAGICVVNPRQSAIDRLRTLGKVAELKQALNTTPMEGTLGIAHTRWATHGEPSESNAHPHSSRDLITLVHNGIIDNYKELRQQLTDLGYRFHSQTDSEVIVHLLHHHWQQNDDIMSALRDTCSQLTGAYALGIIHLDEPDTLYAIRSGSPLVIGVGIDEHFIASDPLALLPVTQQVIHLEEGDIAKLTTASIHIIDCAGHPIQRPVVESGVETSTISKGHFRHFMLKEIYEQSRALQETLAGHFIDQRIIAETFGHQAPSLFPHIKRVHITACGTSYHAALVGRHWLESIAGIPCQVDVASEHRYRAGVVEDDTLLVTLSQSGETADTLAALRQAATKGYRGTLGICNVAHSTLVREADLCFITRAGSEIGVAATKTFTAQLLGLMLLTLSLGEHHQLSATKAARCAETLAQLPSIMDDILQLDPTIAEMAKQFVDKDNALFLGRGALFPIAQEGALKLKEISYMHAEAYPAGELKHGPLALVDENMPVIVVAPHNALFEKLAGNIQEVKARGGKLYIFSNTPQYWQQDAVTTIPMPTVDDFIAPVIYVLPLQLLAYHVAVLKGTDVDQPRNLAKSVTVE